MSRSTKAANGFITGIFQYATQICVQAFLAPIVLRVAGREALGAFAAIMQVLNLLTLVDVAHSWSLERFLGQAIGQEDGGARFRKVFTTARTMLLASSIVFALLVLLLATYIGPLFHLSGDILLQAKRALYVIAVWSIIRTPLAAYNNASIATQDLAATNLIGAIVGILRALASVGFVLAGGGLFGLMVAGTVVEFVASLLYRWRFLEKNPQLIPSWGIPDKSLLITMLRFGGHAMFLNVGNMLTFTSGSMLAGTISGAANASGYYVSQLPGMTGFNVVSRLGESAAPAVNELYGRQEMLRLRHSLDRLLHYCILMIVPVAASVAILNKSLITAWVGPQQYSGAVLTYSLAAFIIVAPIQRIAIIYAFAFGWVRLLTAFAFTQGAVNVGVAILLGRIYGLKTILLVLVIVLLPQTVVLWRKLSQFLGGDLASEIFPQLAKTAAATVPGVVGVLWMEHILPISTKGPVSIAIVITEGVLFFISYVTLAYFSLMTESDKHKLVGIAATALSKLQPKPMDNQYADDAPGKYRRE